MDGLSALVFLGLVVLVAIAFSSFRRFRRRRDSDVPEIPIFLPPAERKPAPVKAAEKAPPPRKGVTEAPRTAPVASQRQPPDLAPEVFEGKTIRFHRPPGVTLQLLPGRLEVISGEDQHEVIRFVRVPGQPAEISLGRSEGAPLRHIQFRAPTVSRQHARMEYTDSKWVIINYSNTNPVVVNGIQLVPPADRHVLTDGDEIELGEVVFRFRE